MTICTLTFTASIQLSSAGESMWCCQTRSRYTRSRLPMFLETECLYWLYTTLWLDFATPIDSPRDPSCCRRRKMESSKGLWAYTSPGNWTSNCSGSRSSRSLWCRTRECKPLHLYRTQRQDSSTSPGPLYPIAIASLSPSPRPRASVASLSWNQRQSSACTHDWSSSVWNYDQTQQKVS